MVDPDLVAFLQVASRRKNLHGKWVPALYWAFLIAKEQKKTEPMAPSDFKTMINKSSLLERKLTPNDGATADIFQIHTNGTRTKSRRVSLGDTLNGTKSRFFVAVETKEKVPMNIDELKKAQKKKNFQEWYEHYSNYVPVKCQQEEESEEVQQQAQQQPNALTVTTTTVAETAAQQQQQPPTVTPTNSDTDGDEQPRTAPSVETEEPEPESILRDPLNSDLLAIFDGLVNPEFLNSPDFFVEKEDDDDTCSIPDTLRDRIRRLGIELQKEKHRKQYEMLEKENPLAEVDCSKHKPALDKFCLPPNKRAIQSVVQIALRIENDTDGKAGLFQLPKYGGGEGKGYGRQLVAIIPSNNLKTFLHNGKQWYPRLLEASRGEEMTDDDAGFAMTKLARYHHEQSFHDVCRTMVEFKQKKMCPWRQILMMHKANLTYETFRTLRPYLNADNCNPFHSERAIRKIEVTPDISPIFAEFDEGGVKKHAWCLPCTELVAQEIEKRESLKEEAIHAIVSADHGQGAMRVNLGLRFIKDNKVVDEVDHLVANVDCKKDNREVMLASQVISIINDSVKTMVAALGIMHVMICAQGDLKWCSDALGKTNMSIHHCHRCRQRHTDFQKGGKSHPLEIINPWTLDKLKEHREKLERRELERTADEARGVVDAPLLEIEPGNFIYPPLHGCVLFANTVFSHFQLYLNHRIQSIPLELLLARAKKTAIERLVEEKKQTAFDLEEQLNGMEADLVYLRSGGAFEDDDDDHRQQFLLLEGAAPETRKNLEAAQKQHEDAKSKLRVKDMTPEEARRLQAAVEEDMKREQHEAEEAAMRQLEAAQKAVGKATGNKATGNKATKPKKKTTAKRKAPKPKDPTKTKTKPKQSAANSE
ncbi:unknown protein [Seminavis robusta]|uniref:Uncharacterized protein n=1 Tax=Seminavis robusta TaxID=568900 RepID=A0A9N8EDM9_9STRA|nr:unknown protein [Seminavis robusta]|eukprot:Sro998_g229500.1 n/a (874) ;mRNA; f:9780-13190